MNAQLQEFDPDGREVEVAGPVTDVAVLAAISKAELDQQITTARAFPRSIRKFISECMEMATLNQDVAAECYYVLPRGGKNIEGPSVRLSEIVQSAWGNCQSGARVVEEGSEFVTAQGIFYDLERNSKITWEVRRRITDKHGKRFNTDMVGVTGNAAASIALRNATFRCIPKAFWQPIYEAVRKCAAGSIKSLAANRTAAFEWLAHRKVTDAMIFAALGVQGMEDIGIDELTTLRGMCTAIKEGTLVETVFAPKDAPATKPKTAAPKSKGKKKDEPAADVKPEGAKDEKKPSDTSVSVSLPVVTLDQATALADKIKEEGLPLTEILALYEIGSLEELPAHLYADAVAKIDEISQTK